MAYPCPTINDLPNNKISGNPGFKHLTKPQDQQAKGETPDSEKVKHYKVKPYAYISIRDQLNDLYYELIRMTLDPLTVLWPDLPQIGNIPKG